MSAGRSSRKAVIPQTSPAAQPLLLFPYGADCYIEDGARGAWAQEQFQVFLGMTPGNRSKAIAKLLVTLATDPGGDDTPARDRSQVTRELLHAASEAETMHMARAAVTRAMSGQRYISKTGGPS